MSHHNRFIAALAGGGSGGHISPGLAVHERLRELDPAARALFLCSSRAIDAQMLRDAGERFIALPATPPSWKPRAAARFLINHRASVRQAMAALRDHDVRCVATLGGFVAAPVVLAANRLNVPVVLVNLDAPPGRANRWISRRCHVVLSAVEVPEMPGWVDEIVGVPIRRVALGDGRKDAARRALDLEAARPTLLVTGASQGARSLNEFMRIMAQRRPEVFTREGWQVLHLAGAGEDGGARAAYERAGIPARVEPFVHRMGLAWTAADLAVTRAGANSVAEATDPRNAVPALYLPYPFHKDMHQRRNAEWVQAAGAGVIETDHVDADVNFERVGPVLADLMGDRDRLRSMAHVLKSRPVQDGAERIARRILDIAAGGTGSRHSDRAEARST